MSNDAGGHRALLQGLLKATEVTSASMTGVDRYGFDMSAMTPQGPLQRRGHTRSRQLADEDQFRRCRYAL
jgi:hypothetical protein